MTIIEQIKTEIERRVRSIENCPFIEAEFGASEKRDGKLIAYKDLLSFLSTLEESERPEPYNPVYDEAYLNEKIKKATESWKGVDVDAMLAECRGYDEEKSEKQIEGLEEEIKNYFQGYWPGTETAEQCNTHLHFTPPAIMRLARHFAKWGAEHAKIDITDFCKPIDPGIAQCIADHSWEMLGEDEKPVPADLEEAADGYVQDRIDAAGHPGWEWEKQDVKDAYIAGAKWQKEQMLKAAVEGEVSHYATVHYVKTNESQLSARLKQFQEGDKVKIIIVKEDEQ